MRTVKRVGLAMRWLSAGALCASCLNVDDISLGALERDAGSERPQDMGAPGPTPPPAMMLTPDAGRAGDAGEMEQEDEEPHAPMRDASAPLDATANAGALDAGADAGSPDAGVDGGVDVGAADAGSDAALSADSGPADASSDAQRSLLCTIEPWHCL